MKREDLSVYKGTVLIVGRDKITVRFTDIEHNVVAEHAISTNTKREEDNS